MFARYNGTLTNSHLIFIYKSHIHYLLCKDGRLLESFRSEHFYYPDIKCSSRREAIQLLKKYYRVGKGQVIDVFRGITYMEFKILGEK